MLTHKVLRCKCYFSSMIFDWLYWKWALKQFFFSFWLSVVSLLRLLVYYRVYLNRKRKPLQCNQGSTLSFWWRYLFFQSESPFVYQVINKTKLSITNFQKQSPWNILIKESRSLNNTICTYNTPCIYFSFYLIIYLFIYYSFCRVCINNLKVWGNLMQLCHNERNFLGYIMKFKRSPNFVSEFTV